MACQRWCVKDGVRQRLCVKDGVTKLVCERWYVTKLVCERPSSASLLIPLQTVLLGTPTDAALR